MTVCSSMPRVLLACVVSALAACTSLAPRLPVPELPVAERWPADAGRIDDSRGASASTLGWRDYFTDPELQYLIATALHDNRDLRLALLRVDEARAAYRIRRADQFPTVVAGGQAARALTPGDLNITGRPLIGSDDELYVGLSSWELDLWGRVRSLKDAALQDYLASESAQRAVRISLIAQVANSYLALRELDERVALAQQAIASRQESFRIFSLRYRVGATSKLDLTQVETLLTQAQALGAQLQQERAARAHALVQLIGAPVELAPDAAQFGDQPLFAELRAGLPSIQLADRPDIVAAEHQLRAANADIGAARADYFPRIALTGSFGTASAELGGLLGAGSRAWTFVPSVSLPVFDAGRRRAGVTVAKVRRDAALASYDQTVQNAFREVADALSARYWLARQVAIQRTTLATETERARLAQLRYDRGTTSYLDVLDAQRELLAAQQSLVQTQRALLSSQVALYAALGGGALADANTPADTATPSR